MSELVHIPFRGNEVLAVDDHGKPFIFLRPAIEHIGLDYSRQLRKLKSRSWACVVPRTMQLPGDGQRREHITTDVRTFLMLLATVDENRVAPEAKGVLVAYQNEVADVIEKYFTQGYAFNPRKRAAAIGPMTVTFDDAMALYFQDHGIDYATGFFTQGLRLAGYLRQGGCVPRKKKRKFFFFNGTSWEIRSWALPLLLGEFEDVLRTFQPYPWAQPRLDDGLTERVLPVKRGES